MPAAVRAAATASAPCSPCARSPCSLAPPHWSRSRGTPPTCPRRSGTGSACAPRTTTLGRVLARLDGDTVDAAIGAWLALHCALPGESDDLCAVAVDGKTLRGSRTVTRRAVHLVAAVTHGERAALNQRQVRGKKGEISAFVPLLAPLDLAGWTVTFDALHTQHAHDRFLVEVKNAHYIAIVKDNHPKLHAFLKRLPWAEIPLGHYCRERAHGRDEIRRLKATAVPRRLRFPHAVQALKVTPRRRNNGTGKIEIERIYAVTSHTAHTATDAQLARAVREHWHIEAHHHVPDTTPARTTPWCSMAASNWIAAAVPVREPRTTLPSTATTRRAVRFSFDRAGGAGQAPGISAGTTPRSLLHHSAGHHRRKK
ncbi:ISAs1 family transposase [Streptomyces sp. NPDC002206]